MALYYFHLRDDSDHVLDPDGVELPNLDVAKGRALDGARDTLSHEIKEGVLDLRYRIDVEDQSGNILHSLPPEEAFELIRA